MRFQAFLEKTDQKIAFSGARSSLKIEAEALNPLVFPANLQPQKLFKNSMNFKL